METIKIISTILREILGIYSTIIVVRIIISWILLIRNRRNGYSQYQTTLDKIDSFLGKIVDPYLGLFKNVKSLKGQTFDLTPILAIVVLNLGQNIFLYLSQTGQITLGFILALIVHIVWNNLFRYFYLILMVLLVIRIILSATGNIGGVNAIDPIIERPVLKVYRLFFRKSNSQVKDQTLVVVTLLCTLIVYCVINGAVKSLIGFLISSF